MQTRSIVQSAAAHCLKAAAHGLASVALATFSPALAAQSLDSLLQPPGPIATARIVDSNIEVSNSLSAYWVDDETVIFNGYTSETWEHWTPLREVPVIRVTTWNFRTGEVKTYDEVSSSSGVLCYFKGRVMLSTYRKSEDGQRIRAGGRYVEEWRGGSLGDVRPLGPEDLELLRKEKFDPITCQAPSAFPPVPRWIQDSKWWYQRLPAQYGVKVDDPVTADGQRLPPLLCDYASASREHCRVLPLPAPRSYGWSFIQHLGALALYGQAYRGVSAGLTVALLYPDARVEVTTIPPDSRLDIPYEAAITRIGLIRVKTNSGSPSHVGDGGIWLWNRGDQKRLAATAAYLARSGQGAVSPNGCAVAFGGTDRPDIRRLTLRIAQLCPG